MSMHKTTLALGQLLRSVHMEKSYHGKAGYPVLANRLKKLPYAGRWKTRVNSNRRRTVHRGKVNPGVTSCPGFMGTGPKC